MNSIGIQEIILLVLLGLFIGWLLRPKKNASDTLSMEDIIDNDPVIKKLDKEIGDLNDSADKRMKESLPESTLEILSEYGLSGAFTKEQINDRKKQRIENEKLEKIEKINNYFREGFISEEEKNEYLNTWIQNKKPHNSGEPYYRKSEELTNTNEDLWSTFLMGLDKLLENDRILKVYGSEFGWKIIEGEVWLNMNESQLRESRGYPDDKEQELTPNGEIEVFIYGNKRTGSYFTLQDGKVIKIKDRQKKEY